ncbi:MAG: RNA polymerase sigma-70 factor [Flavobacteriales bacterium]|nr:RNA polymerase sigma-70 factor [Bacteroidota bacterium]MCB9239621.1 RNA polymerase sigma-70 factor [Flavobacteriales bacterium]
MEERFKELYFKHFEELVRFARFYTHDLDEASSAVQQVFLKIWERREELLERDDLKSYLFTAVRNTVFTERRRGVLHTELDDVHQDTTPGPEARLQASQLQHQLESVVARLPERCRYIFELSRFEQLSHAEIAKRLDISPKTIENQITKALKLIREQII